MGPLPAGSPDSGPWLGRWRHLTAGLRKIHDARQRAFLLQELLSRGRGRVLAFVNAHAMNSVVVDEGFFQALDGADILLRDGSGMALMDRMRHLEAGLNMNGTDFIPRLLRAFRGRRVAFWGTRQPYLARAAEGAQREFAIHVVSQEDGFQEGDRYLQLARDPTLDLIVLGMGMPKQERIAQRIHAEIPGHPLVVCGGAILDFLGGKVSRAPRWMRRCGIEWAYRLGREPVRLCRRYLVGNVLFLWRAAKLKGKPAMSMNRIVFLLAGLMGAASVGAMMARPTVRIAEQGPKVVLETMVPRRFGDWQEEPERQIQAINPQTRQLLDRLYSQILSRTYVNGQGYRMMLSIAYGGDQREGLEAHKPEACYPAQGFNLVDSRPAVLATPWGNIAARRVLATLGGRKEPITYWYTVGNRSIGNGIQKKLVEMRFGLTGRIPDGLLFRVSSIDPEPGRAYQAQIQFVSQLLAAVPAADRQRLSGLAAP